MVNKVSANIGKLRSLLQVRGQGTARLNQAQRLEGNRRRYRGAPVPEQACARVLLAAMALTSGQSPNMID